ncbi:terpenoid cyclases/Protein prenyltransferase [Mytilinidion resinicola]|uniref:Protein farnesyltransferase subunit beta n=1 Tax=Mytilinidion resinicola TaxID=574789 RepID=A0A6A6YVN5_9PEZI|nr:terpenoid cyclases/Protein prenyltransferase [Mytilinidion resinicola]KAF2812618.1 terpenoid cyclases/Protein prenyltransferase [Mytilinidion resinicola]
MATPQAPSQSPSARLQELLTTSQRIEELSDSEGFEDAMEPASAQAPPSFPKLQMFTSPLRDELVTDSSAIEAETLDDILPFLEDNPYDFELNSFGVPKLQRAQHVAFLRRALGNYPAQFAAMDAARPWLLYWSLQGLTCLGEDVSEYRERVTYTFSAAQHPMGGFGGGHGQLPHLAGSYAAVLSLVIVGGKEAYDMIDRKAMWHYLGNMKQPDGGFTMAPGGEEDVRGAFCAMVILTLLNLPLDLPPTSPAKIKGDETFLTKLPEWISRCQTFEGGIGAAPTNEAHGGYAFCALGCLALIGSPKEMLHKHLDVPALLSWLASRQTQPEGGFQGRTNKLVDGCYSHWVGGCWGIVEAAVQGSNDGVGARLWRREDLVRYILACCQGQKGGLRDKPGKHPDAYHTCYNLAGLSAAQHRYVYDYEKSTGAAAAPLSAAFNWTVADVVEEEGKIWDEDDTVNIIHPVFVVPWGQAEAVRKYFEEKA